MSIKGASIILWFYDEDKKQPVLLTGKESTYVSDLLKDPAFNDKYSALIREKENYSGADLAQAKLYFSKGAKELEEILRIQKIKFDTPVLIESNLYKVNYRHLTETSKRGIIKGGINLGETPIDTILRETAEEIGINIPKEQMVDLGICEGYQVYSLDIKQKNFAFFMSRIKEREIAKSGEVFDLSFKHLSTIEGLFPEYNKRSNCAIIKFKEYFKNLTKKGGERRKMKHSRKNKTSRKTNKSRINKKSKRNKSTKKRKHNSVK